MVPVFAYYCQRVCIELDRVSFRIVQPYIQVFFYVDEPKACLLKIEQRKTLLLFILEIPYLPHVIMHAL